MTEEQEEERAISPEETVQQIFRIQKNFSFLYDHLDRVWDKIGQVWMTITLVLFLMLFFFLQNQKHINKLEAKIKVLNKITGLRK